jgi:hypothetical protein
MGNEGPIDVALPIYYYKINLFNILQIQTVNIQIFYRGLVVDYFQMKLIDIDIQQELLRL